MNNAKVFYKKGFTLIEVLVTISIFSVLIFGVAAILNDIFVNSNQQVLSMNNIDQARLVSSKFINEIRNATTGNDGSYPLNQTSDSQIIFYSNYGTSNMTVNRIRYFVSENVLYKGVIAPSGNPLSYNLASESVKPVLSGLYNGSVHVFYYYDGSYAGNTNALVQPVNINQIRFVKINLAVLNQITLNDINTFTVAVGTTVRSVKDNLGN